MLCDEVVQNLPPAVGCNVMNLTKINNQILVNIEVVNLKKIDKQFIFQVTDNSMEAASGLTFPLGSYILIDPFREPKENDYVIAKPNNDDKAVFRQLITTNNNQILHPLNQKYRDMPFTHQGIISGVVSQTFYSIKKWQIMNKL